MAAPTAPPAVGRRARHLPWLAVLLTSLVIAVYAPGQYLFASLTDLAESETGLASTYAARPAAIQLAFYVHIVFAGLALLVGGFQFSRTLRRRSPRLHRLLGRIYVASVFVGGVAALVMSFYSSVALLGLFGFGTLAVLWIWTTHRGYQSARDGDFAAHQAWMIRSYALTYAAPTLRMWLFVLLLVQLPFGVDPGLAFVNAYAPVPFLCWLPNIVVAEYIVYRRGLPSLNLGALQRNR